MPLCHDHVSAVRIQNQGTRIATVLAHKKTTPMPIVPQSNLPNSYLKLWNYRESKDHSIARKGKLLRTGDKRGERNGRALTESIIREEIEGILIARVCELVVAGRELLEALGSDGVEVPFEAGELCEHDRATGHKAVDQRRLLARHGEEIRCRSDQNQKAPFLQV
jgi:hypothetical protein